MSIRKWLMAAAAAAALTGVSNSSSAMDVASGDAGFSPRVLSSSDARLYREIFADEEAGRFADAKDRLAEVSDRSLVGYVEAAHLLSPKAKRVPLKQLTAWLAEHDDLPIAARVREFAERKNEKQRPRRRVAIESLPTVHHRGGGYEDTDIPDVLISDAGRAAQVQILASAHAGQPLQAEATLNALIASGAAPGSDIAHLSHRVAASYMAEAQDDGAVRVASAVTGVDRAAQPLLDWDEGLANYRLGQISGIGAAFRNAGAGRLDAELHAQRRPPSGPRARICQAGDPLRVVTLLTAAAREEPTFYGMLAERMLGEAIADELLRSGARSRQLRRDDADAGRASRRGAMANRRDARRSPPKWIARLTAIDLHQGAGLCGARAHRLDLPNLELRACETAGLARRDADGSVPRAALHADRRLSASIPRWCSLSRAPRAVSSPMPCPTRARAG